MASRNPACISQWRVRDTSAGESGIALLIGPRVCSMRSRIAGLFSGCRGCWLPKARRRAPSTELGVTTAAPKAKTAATTVRNTTITRAKDGVITGLHLNPDDFSDHKVSDRLQRDSRDQQKVADGIGK